MEDILQDVFVHVWEHAELFDPSRGHFLGWIITIARRRSLDRVRQRSAYQRATDRFEAVSRQRIQDGHGTWTVDREVRCNELREQIDASMRELPVHQSEVVALTFFKGLSQREIAASLNIPLGTVKTRMELGMKKLSRAAFFQEAA